MFNFTTRVRKALLAAAFLIGSGGAMAGPNYLVTIHTQAASGESGLVDFTMGSTGDAPRATAHLWNFSGTFGAEFDRAGGIAGDLASGVYIDNSGPTNYLTQSAVFGGDLSFFLSFSGDYEMIESDWNNVFGVVLYDSFLGEQSYIAAQFDVLSAYQGLPGTVLAQADVDTDILEVPEPSQLLLMLSALALAGFVLRRKA